MADILLYQGEANPNDVRLQAVGTYLLVANAGSFALTGQDAALRQTRIVAPNVGTCTLTGIVDALRQARIISAAVGTFTEAGQSANLLQARIVSAATAAFTLTGQAASLRAARNLVATVGQFAETGRDTAERQVRILAAASGSYTLTGIAATLTYDPGTPAYTLVAGVGSGVLTGKDAGLSTTGSVESASAYGAVYYRPARRPAQKVEVTPKQEREHEVRPPILQHYALRAETASFTLAGADAALSVAHGIVQPIVSEPPPGELADTEVQPEPSIGRLPLTRTVSVEAAADAILRAPEASDFAAVIDDLIASTAPGLVSHTLGAESGAFACAACDAALVVRRAPKPEQRKGDVFIPPTPWTPESEQDDALLYAIGYDLLTR